MVTVTQALARLANRIRIGLENVVLVSSNTIGDFNTFYGAHVSADAGLLYAAPIDVVAPYIGTNIYLRPVNRDAPLSLRGGFMRRFSITVGLTVKGIDDEQGTRFNLFGAQAGVIGFGYRLAESVKMTLGALVFRKRNEAALQTDKELTANAFVAFSFDINIGGSVFGGLFKP
jgi:hypothetical protein